MRINYKSKLLSIFFLLLIGLPFESLQAQGQWGEERSYYIYRMISMSSSLYNQYVFDRDTIVEGELSKVVKVYKIEFYGIGELVREEDEFLGNLIFRNEGDSIYWWNEEEFRYLYDLTPDVGDEWVLLANDAYECSSTPLPDQDVLTITGEGVQDVFGTSYPVNSLSNQDAWTIGNKIFRNIGASSSPFPIPEGAGCLDVDVFSAVPEVLICYYHPTEGINRLSTQPTPVTCEGLAVSVKETWRSKDHEFTIYPNPSNGNEIFIRSSGILSGEIQIQIFDFTGKKISSEYQYVGDSIDVSFLPKGIYFLGITKSHSLLSVEKIVIQ